MKRSVKQVETGKIAWRFVDPVKAIHNRGADAKHTGDEPQYPAVDEQDKWTGSEYTRRLISSLNWYNSTQDYKTSYSWTSQFLERNPRRARLATAIKNGDIKVPPTVGYALRAGRAGLKLRFNTLRSIVHMIKEAELPVVGSTLAPTKEKKEEPAIKAPNIQDRLAEKAREAAGEIEGRFDDFITTNEFKGEPKAVELLSQFNVQPGHIKTITILAERRIKEYEEVLAGKDGQLVEAYSHYGKRQLNAVIKWWNQVISDCNSYGIIKKANKAPRKKKPVSPEKVVSKIKYLKEFKELNLKSIEPVQILQAEELWVYNTKTRKLGVYIVDSHQSKLSVKGTSIQGFDSVQSVQKTLRKPKEQLKEWSSNGKPAAKKWHKGIRSVETKLNGRLNEDIILLKAYK